MYALAETAISFESIAYLLALAAVLFLQQRAAARAKEAVDQAAAAAIAAAAAAVAAEKLKVDLAAVAQAQAKAAEKAEADLKAIKATTEDTAKNVVGVYKFSNGALGASLAATALSARLLANNTVNNPEHLKAADEAELAASEHRRKEQDAARVIAQRSEAIAVENAKATKESK